MDPLFKIREKSERLPPSILRKIGARIKYLREGVARVEAASEIAYPAYYVEPSLIVTSSAAEVGQVGVLYARTLPVEGPEGLEILVQISAPLVAFASKGTIHTVMAHEFLHYADMVKRFTKMSILSEDVSGTLFESLYADYGKFIKPQLLLKDRGLVRMLKSKFSNGLNDKRLHEKTVKEWLERGLPTIPLPPDANVVRIPLAAILGAKFDPLLKLKLQKI